jgi:hypothetical protein
MINSLVAFLFAYAKAHAGGFIGAATVLFTTVATNGGHLTATGWWYAIGGFVASWLGIAFTSNTTKDSTGTPVVVPPIATGAPSVSA